MLLSLLSKRSLEVESSNRDSYGFAVRPQHLQRYKEYTDVYKEEEKERSDKWDSFLKQHVESAEPSISGEEHDKTFDGEVAEEIEETILEKDGREDDSWGGKPFCKVSTAIDPSNVLINEQEKSKDVKEWGLIRPYLGIIEKMMSFRIRNGYKMEIKHLNQNHLQSIEEERPMGVEYDKDFKETYSDKMLGTRVDSPTQAGAASDEVSSEPSFSWKELEFLVHGGVPRALRGEVWQAFVGVGTRRVERYYQDLLAPEPETNVIHCTEHDNSSASNSTKPNVNCVSVPEKWRKQIEKDLPRTFPGHPALNENGRNSLRRLLLAYARHNPSVGYCQAMNFFAGLLLLMMPEENAFWTLVGIIDEYFEGCYSEEMIESQVDQLVFEELMRERFPKLVNHLDYLGVEFSWISGPWFLSIFVNILPWESLLRVWDVLLFEGNRLMLFRTALALMDLYGPALVTTKDAGDAVILLQSLAGSTFDSSQLVLTACVGFLAVNEAKLQELREKHRPTILEAAEERKKQGQVLKDAKGLGSKLYSFKHAPGNLIIEASEKEDQGDKFSDEARPLPQKCFTDLDELLNGRSVNSEVQPGSDLQEKVVWLKAELYRLMEENRSATSRAEELETALMEMTKQDNQQLSARIELLELEVSELHQVLAQKQEQETTMLQALMKVEQEQRVTEDARIRAERDAASQRYALNGLEEKYEKATAALPQMEKRVVMAESMLEATLQYESGQVKALSSPGRSVRPDLVRPERKAGLLSRPFTFWSREADERKSNSGENAPKASSHGDVNGLQEQEKIV